MKYLDHKSNEINSIYDWEDKIFKNTSKENHWEPGRSAHSLADFMMNKEGEDYFKKYVSQLLSEDVEFEKAIPELKVDFDKYDHGREHDLGIYGCTKSGKSIFIGVEAKVDEQFREKISTAYLNGITEQLKGKNSNTPNRIEDLFKLHFTNITNKIWNLRYQLLYATVGTLAAKADISILFIIVFKTNAYNAKKGRKNYKDYMRFIKLTDSKKINFVKDFEVHEIIIGGKKLYSVYTSI